MNDKRKMVLCSSVCEMAECFAADTRAETQSDWSNGITEMCIIITSVSIIGQ